MAKTEHHLSQRHIRTEDGIGQIVEAKITEDDNLLPTPSELAAYKEISPDLVQHFLDTAVKEQEVRHTKQLQQVEIFNIKARTERDATLRGMNFALISFICCAILTGLALYLGHLVFAGVLSGAVILGVVRAFLFKRSSE